MTKAESADIHVPPIVDAGWHYARIHGAERLVERDLDDDERGRLNSEIVRVR